MAICLPSVGPGRARFKSSNPWLPPKKLICWSTLKAGGVQCGSPTVFFTVSTGIHSHMSHNHHSQNLG